MKSAYLKGGVQFLLAVVAGVALLAIGVLLGARVFGITEMPSRFSPGEDRRTGSPVSAEATPNPEAGGASDLRPPATSSATATDVGGGPSDADSVLVPPSGDGGEPITRSAVEYLERTFGSELTPKTVGSATRRGLPTVTESTVVTVYSGKEGTGLDLLEVVITRTSNNESAVQTGAELSSVFEVGRLGYVWGGRQIMQSMNREENPEKFPPVLAFVWTQERYVVRVLAIPVGPAAVEQARASALEFISELSY